MYVKHVAVTQDISTGSREAIVKSIIRTSNVNTRPAMGALNIPAIAPAALVDGQAVRKHNGGTYDGAGTCFRDFRHRQVGTGDQWLDDSDRDGIRFSHQLP